MEENNWFDLGEYSDWIDDLEYDKSEKSDNDDLESDMDYGLGDLD